MKTRPIKLSTPTLTPPGVDDPAAASGRAGRIIRRPDDPVGLVERAAELALVPDVVAGGDEVDAGREHLVGGLLREPEAAGGVFAVGDHEIDVVLFAEQAGDVWQSVSRPGEPTTSAMARIVSCRL